MDDLLEIAGGAILYVIAMVVVSVLFLLTLAALIMYPILTIVILLFVIGWFIT